MLRWVVNFVQKHKPNNRPTQLYTIKQIYDICGGDMFRLFSVRHPQALHKFLNHKAEEVLLNTVALGSTQPLTEMSTTNISWG
jgi:hypothetical protein